MDGIPLISAVLPARNEDSVIGGSIRAIHDALAGTGRTFEIIVADSASSDGTGAVALSAVPSNVRVVRVDQPGKGRALTAAMLETRGDIVGFLDADLEIHPAFFLEGVQRILGGADVAIGSKINGGTTAPDGPEHGSPSRPLHRRSITWGANLLLRTGLGTPYHDHQAGMKVFRGDLIRDVVRSVSATGWLWDAEVLARLHRRGILAEEVPVAVVQSRLRRSHLAPPMAAARAASEVISLILRMRLDRRSPGGSAG